jgi:hypothetical protein
MQIYKEGRYKCTVIDPRDQRGLLALATSGFSVVARPSSPMPPGVAKGLLALVDIV